MNFSQELTRLSLTKRIVSLIPAQLKFRTAKFLYNYQSSKVNGIDIIVPYLSHYNYLLNFSLNTKELIGWNIFFFGEYEPLTNKILKFCLKEGDIVIEAGANNGSETLLISKLIGRGIVYGFEPIPHVFQRLKTNIEINDLQGNVKIVDFALGEEDKTVQFNVFPKDFPNQGMSSKYLELSNKINIQQKKLDSWVKEENLARIDFIKMDIQGAELDLLLGAEESILKFKPIIFTEADNELNMTKNLYNHLDKLGYSVYLINKEELKSLNESNLKDGNWLAIHKDSSINSRLPDLKLTI